MNADLFGRQVHFMEVMIRCPTIMDLFFVRESPILLYLLSKQTLYVLCLSNSLPWHTPSMSVIIMCMYLIYIIMAMANLLPKNSVNGSVLCTSQFSSNVVHASGAPPTFPVNVPDPRAPPTFPATNNYSRNIPSIVPPT